MVNTRDKRGLHYVIVIFICAVILIVLIAMIGMLAIRIGSDDSNGNSTRASNIQFFSTDSNFVVIGETVKVDGKNISFSVKRDGGIKNVVGFQMVLEDANENVELIKTLGSINVGEVKEYNFQYSNIKKIKYLTLVPITSDSQGREVGYVLT
jgi:hypothetical protein